MTPMVSERNTNPFISGFSFSREKVTDELFLESSEEKFNNGIRLDPQERARAINVLSKIPQAEKELIYFSFLEGKVSARSLPKLFGFGEGSFQFRLFRKKVGSALDEICKNGRGVKLLCRVASEGRSSGYRSDLKTSN
jgi:hypothetical protein